MNQLKLSTQYNASENAIIIERVHAFHFGQITDTVKCESFIHIMQT